MSGMRSEEVNERGEENRRLGRKEENRTEEEEKIGGEGKIDRTEEEEGEIRKGRTEEKGRGEEKKGILGKEKSIGKGGKGREEKYGKE